jgi:hypothetical protein
MFNADPDSAFLNSNSCVRSKTLKKFCETRPVAPISAPPQNRR